MGKRNVRKTRLSNTVVLLVGKSGSGKTAVTQELERRGYKSVASYTSRPPRYQREPGHIFVTAEEVMSLDNIVAYTFFDGNHYAATQAQVDQSDLYVIDPKGVKFFNRTYKGKRFPIVVNIDVPLHVRIWRMLRRGDKLADVIRRVRHDKTAFDCGQFPFPSISVQNKDIRETVEAIEKYARLIDTEQDDDWEYKPMTLYSNNCPKCRMIKNALEINGIPFTVCSDETVFMPIAQEHGIMTMPFAEIDGQYLDAKALQNWVQGEDD